MPYCTACGKELERRRDGTYDYHTGEPNQEYACTNPQCWYGQETLCLDAGGHKMDSWGVCKVCRHDMYAGM